MADPGGTAAQASGAQHVTPWEMVSRPDTGNSTEGAVTRALGPGARHLGSSGSPTQGAGDPTLLPPVSTEQDAVPRHTHTHTHTCTHARHSCGVSGRRQGPGKRATEAHCHQPGHQPHAERSLRGVWKMASLQRNNLILQVGLCGS